MGLDGLESICFWVEVDFEQVIREFLFHCWQEEERQIAPAICSDVASCDDFYWVLLGFVRFRSIMVRKAATDVSARPSSSLAGLDWVWLGYTVLIKLKLCWFEFISKLSLFIVVRAGNERTNCVFKPFPLPNKYNYKKNTPAADMFRVLEFQLRCLDIFFLRFSSFHFWHGSWWEIEQVRHLTATTGRCFLFDNKNSYGL